MDEETILEVKAGHRHEPDGTILLRPDGTRASLLNPLDYPVTSVCTVCGEKIRTRAMFIATDWYAAGLQAAAVEPVLVVGDLVGGFRLRRGDGPDLLGQVLRGDRDPGQLGYADAAAAEQRHQDRGQLDPVRRVHVSPYVLEASGNLAPMITAVIVDAAGKFTETTPAVEIVAYQAISELAAL